jgi:acetyl-CoA carboxylase biotin carboxylase subunit
MFKKILIANRGEIALRIIRTCKELGIKTVAVHSLEDGNSLHVKFADESICIGENQSKESYLNIPAIISAVEITDAEAIHPGDGFLAENAHFVEICESSNIGFIGPTSEVVRKLGHKIEARETVREAGVSVLPGSSGVVKDEKEAIAIAQNLGYPVIIKSALGGGGKGTRIAHTDVSLANAFITSQAEVKAAFGEAELYIEKYIEGAKHIEVQILGDHFGRVLHLGERDCSIQRRHQKLIEEAPSPFLDKKERRKLTQAAVQVARALKYTNAGTVEFLVDKNKNFYFLEVNSRIQVEHPVTEMVTGVDIVKEQIRIASGEKLPWEQHQIKFQGHAIECQINAEDTERNFQPRVGKILSYHPPAGLGIRVDTHVYSEYTIPPGYDSLIAKLIVHGASRDESITRMVRALDEFIIEGIPTTIPFHKKAIQHPLFRKGDYNINFVEKIEEK